MKIELLCEGNPSWKKEAIEDIDAALDELRLKHEIDFEVPEDYKGGPVVKIDGNEIAYIEKGECIGNRHYFFKTEEKYYYDAKDFIEDYIKKQIEEVKMEDVLK
jgi:hypothetical protein